MFPILQCNRRLSHNLYNQYPVDLKAFSPISKSENTINHLKMLKEFLCEQQKQDLEKKHCRTQQTQPHIPNQHLLKRKITPNKENNRCISEQIQIKLNAQHRQVKLWRNKPMNKKFMHYYCSRNYTKVISESSLPQNQFKLNDVLNYRQNKGNSKKLSNKIQYFKIV